MVRWIWGPPRWLGLDRDADRLLRGWPLSAARRLAGRPTWPAVNLSESGDQWRLECELPGVHKDDVDISVTGAQVVIKGEMKAPEGAEARSYHRSERRFGSFSRVIELPARADVEQMTAELRDGVLVMDIAKAPEARPRKIAVKGE